MWRRLTRLLARYPSAVVTLVGEDGYPVSFRCRPAIDPAGRLLLIDPPASVTVQAGRVGMLCHSHNERLWRLRSFHVRGELVSHGNRWVLAPERLTLGMGHGGLRAQIRLVRRGKQTAAAYLERRGWEAPPIDWHRFDDIKREVFG